MTALDTSVDSMKLGSSKLSDSFPSPLVSEIGLYILLEQTSSSVVGARNLKVHDYRILILTVNSFGFKNKPLEFDEFRVRTKLVGLEV